jgi:uncharacterized protein involved in cysteine biosynthesis
MTPRAVRRAERAAHLLWGLLIVGFVYGLLPAWGEPLLQWVVIPAAVASGLAMWFAAPIRRTVRRLSGRWTGTALDPSHGS